MRFINLLQCAVKTKTTGQKVRGGVKKKKKR